MRYFVSSFLTDIFSIHVNFCNYSETANSDKLKLSLKKYVSEVLTWVMSKILVKANKYPVFSFVPLLFCADATRVIISSVLATKINLFML